MRKTSKVKNGIASFFKYFFMILLIFISLAPIVWAFISSFKSYAGNQLLRIVLAVQIQFG